MQEFVLSYHLEVKDIIELSPLYFSANDTSRIILGFLFYLHCCFMPWPITLPHLLTIHFTVASFFPLFVFLLLLLCHDLHLEQPDK